MFPQFTEEARRALTAMLNFAGELGEQYAGTEHLLMGLVSQEADLPAEVAGKVTVDALKEQMTQKTGAAAPSVTTGHIEMTPRCYHILQRSIQESHKTGHRFTSLPYIWQALVADDGSTACHLLENLGVDLGKLMADLSAEISSHPAMPGEAAPRRIPVSGSEAGLHAENPEEDGVPSSIRPHAKSKTPFLDKYCHNLTKDAADGKLDPVIGRETELNRIMQILLRRTKNNPVIIGEPGVGKTAIVEGLAANIASGRVPDVLAGKQVLSLNMGSLVAGTKFRGEFEDRIKNLLEETSSSGNTILFIDELHSIIGAGDSEGTMDAANLLKPALSRGDFQLIGATTLDEYRKHIEKDAALERRFQPVNVSEPSTEEALNILHGLRERYEKHHGITISDEALETAVSLSDRYISDRYLPDKAVDLMDEAASRVRISSFTPPPDLHLQEAELKAIQENKNSAIANQEYEKAGMLRDREKALTSELEARRAAWEQTRAAARTTVTGEDIARVVSQWTGIPVSRMTQTEAERLMGLEDALHHRVIGQHEAISALSRAIRRSRAGLQDPNRPIGSFIFLGPTGVGKTELCRALAEAMFGNEDAMIRIDMSEYMEKHAVSRMIGSPPGYVGYDEGGQLTEAVRRKPYSVVLFDEIEKAHPDVFNLLLQMLDDGRLTDSNGRVVSFKNTIIVMTSNAGAHQLMTTRSMGFGTRSVTDEVKYDDMKDTVMKEVRDLFRPEFINRIDEMIVFHALTSADIRAITEMQLKGVAERLSEQRITLTWTPEAADYLAEIGYEPKFGARQLRRIIQSRVEDTLSEELLLGHIALGDQVCLVRDGDRIAVEKR